MLHKPGENGKNKVSRTKETGTGVGYAKGRLTHPSTSVVLNGIHACLLLKGVWSSACFICYWKGNGMNKNGIKETRGNGTKGYSPSIAFVPTYLIGNENQSSVVRTEFGETYARQASHLCLHISLARENQSAVVRLTTGCAFCLFVFFFG